MHLCVLFVHQHLAIALVDMMQEVIVQILLMKSFAILLQLLQAWIAKLEQIVSLLSRRRLHYALVVLHSPPADEAQVLRIAGTVNFKKHMEHPNSVY